MKLMVDQDDIMIYNGFIKNDAHLACEKVRMIVAGIEDATGINSDQSFDVRVIISELVQMLSGMAVLPINIRRCI